MSYNPARSDPQDGTRPLPGQSAGDLLLTDNPEMLQPFSDLS